MQIHARLPLLAFLLSSLGSATELTVPGDYSDLDAAVQAAQPGDVIRVQTGQQQPPITITVPLTIIGDPIARIGDVGPAPFSNGRPGVTLAGPGSGTVTLAQVELSTSLDVGFMAPVLTGGGFSELHLSSSTAIEPRTGFTGLGEGAPALSVSVPYVLVTDSTVIGGADDIDICWFASQPPADFDSYAAIYAPSSTVVLVDSEVRGGGQAGSSCCQFCACPGALTDQFGKGGPGVVAERVFLAGGTLAGGQGVVVFAWPNQAGGGTYVSCGVQPDGPAALASEIIVLGGNLFGSGPPRLGQSWTLSYNTPGPVAYLLLGFNPTSPTLVPGFGWYHMSAAGPILFGPLPTAVPATFPLPIPSSTALLGLELVFQLVDTSDGLSRPVIGTIVP